MLTPKQEKWIAHLSKINKIKIVPYDPNSHKIYEKVKKNLQYLLSKNISVEHHGATSLGISGQDEIDIYIPINPKEFNSLLEQLIKIYGEPKSHYPLERARFSITEQNKRVDIFLINVEDDGWINGIKFENYLRSHSKALDSYRKLKEKGNGLCVQEYYRNKTEFINEILAKSNKS